MDALPKPLAQLVESVFPLADLSLNPAVQAGILRTTAEQEGLISGQLNGRCKLRGTPFAHAFAALALPAQGAGLPEHLTLKGRGEILLLDPMFDVGMGVAVAHPISEGGTVAIGIPQMAWDVLAVGLTDCFQGIEETEQAVAFFGTGQVEGCLG